MAQKRPLLTEWIESTILAYVRAGGFAHVAAEAAGVPRELFEEWMRLGEKSHPVGKYRLFAHAVRQAEAQARLSAEVAALKGKPVDWLKAGPGKETDDKPGWSALAKPRGGNDKPMSPLLDPGVQELLRTLLRVLERYPDARIEVVDALNAIRPEET
jgi:hypothetical protein